MLTPMFIHDIAWISPQETNGTIDLDMVHAAEKNILKCRDLGSCEGVPANVLRRMGRAVRMGTSVALQLLQPRPQVNGILTGTANGGMEDCFRFLHQLLEYNEGTLTPTGFVQSTANAIASQVGLLTGNNGYNITHVHRGLAFENAVLDAMMFLQEHPQAELLLCGVEEYSPYNHNLMHSDGWYKDEEIPNAELYAHVSPGTIAGEGAAGFIVNANAQNALARLDAVRILSTRNEEEVVDALNDFAARHAGGFDGIDLVLSGENGDSRQLDLYERCYTLLPSQTAIARFKHFTGEYATAGSAALWLACRFLHTGQVPGHFIKTASQRTLNRVLICNRFAASQHAFYLVSLPGK